MLFRSHESSSLTRVLRSTALLICGCSMGCQPELNVLPELLDCSLGIVRKGDNVALLDFYNSSSDRRCTVGAARPAADSWRLLTQVGDLFPAPQPDGVEHRFPIILPLRSDDRHAGLWVFRRETLTTRIGDSFVPLLADELATIRFDLPEHSVCDTDCKIEEQSDAIDLSRGKLCSIPEQSPFIPFSSDDRESTDRCFVRIHLVDG